MQNSSLALKWAQSSWGLNQACSTCPQHPSLLIQSQGKEAKVAFTPLGCVTGFLCHSSLNTWLLPHLQQASSLSTVWTQILFKQSLALALADHNASLKDWTAQPWQPNVSFTGNAVTTQWRSPLHREHWFTMIAKIWVTRFLVAGWVTTRLRERCLESPECCFVVAVNEMLLDSLDFEGLSGHFKFCWEDAGDFAATTL